MEKTPQSSQINRLQEKQQETPLIKIGRFLDLFANINIYENQDDILEKFSELYESNKEQYIKVITQNINPKKPDDYFKAGITLEFIKNLYTLSFDTVYYPEDLFEQIKEVLIKTLREKDNSYLLNVRAEDAYKTITRIRTLTDIESEEEKFEEEMKNKYGGDWQKKWRNEPENFEYIPTESEYDEVPFEITEKTYAFFDKNNLFIARPENFHAITDSINKYRKAKKESMVSIITLSDDELIQIGENPEEKDNLSPFYYIENPKHPHALLEAQETLENIKKYFSIPLSIKDLSIKRQNKTPEEIEQSKQNLFDYTYLMSKPIRERVEEEFGLKFKFLSFQEQFYFLRLIKNKTEEEMERVKDFTAQYGHNGLKTFMSLEFDRNLGDKIIIFGEKFDSSMVREIFQKYSEIIDSAQDAFKYFQDNFAQTGTPNQKIIDRIEENLFKKGKDLLAHFANRVVRGEKINEEELLKELENIKTETLLFISSFKILKEGGVPMNLADIAATKYEANDAEKIKDDTVLIEQMTRIYKQNYKSYPLEFTDELLKSFTKSLKNPNTILFTLKHKEELMAFCRLEKELDENGEIESFYFGSFNVNPLYQQSRLGEALLEAAILKANEFNMPIKANCDPLAPMTQKYIKSGFVATEVYDFKDVPSFKIEYDNTLRNNLESIKLAKGEVIETAKQEKKNDIIIQNWPISEKPNFELLNQGYLLTQYFTDKGKLYAVFEKDPRLQEKDNGEMKKAA